MALDNEKAEDLAPGSCYGQALDCLEQAGVDPTKLTGSIEFAPEDLLAQVLATAQRMAEEEQGE